MSRITENLFCAFMIVCSCNIPSDHDVRNAANAADDVLRNVRQVYDCLGCGAECGRCARTIKAIIDEAYAECALGCEAGCERPRVINDAQDDPKVAPKAPYVPGFAG